MLKYTPAVFAVGNDYQIIVPVTGHSLFRVLVGDRYFYDEQNGIMCSLRPIHRVTIPMKLLDEAKKYTVCEREIIDRKPYFPLTEDEVRTEFDFTPIPENNIRIYHVADTHNKSEEPIRAAETFGRIDLLVMNGDIPNHSGEIENFDTIYRIAEGITHGNIPIVFARGNHDLRGYHAEEIADYTPNRYGSTFFTVRLGKLWALILDCGEDKDDSHAEYGLTVACHCFRERQTDFIRSVIANAASEYAAEGVEHRLVICHNPFTYQLDPPFDIEPEIYSEWARLIRENVKPELMLCGHLHRLLFCPVGGELDHLGQPCPLVVGSDISEHYHAGCGLILGSEHKTPICFCDSDGRAFFTDKELSCIVADGTKCYRYDENESAPGFWHYNAKGKPTICG